MVDDDTRRAQAAERSRRYRARKRAAVEDPSIESAGEAHPDRNAAPAAPSADSIEVEVDRAIASMKQLSPSDSAIVALARRTARQVDDLLAEDPIGHATRIFSGMNTLTRILHELGGTPTVRQQYEFRSRRLLEQNATEGQDAGNEAAPTARAGNVTTLRPPKRQRA